MIKSSLNKTNLKNRSLCFYTDLLNYAYRLTRNHEDAQDLVQESYLKAYVNIDKIKYDSNLKAWHYKILYNLFCSQYRRNEKYINSLSRVYDNFCFEKAFINYENLSEKISLNEITSIINNLQKKYSLISFLYFLKEFTQKEIECLLNLKLGTVKSRIYRSRELLKGEIEHRMKDKIYLKAI